MYKFYHGNREIKILRVCYSHRWECVFMYKEAGQPFSNSIKRRRLFSEIDCMEIPEIKPDLQYKFYVCIPPLFRLSPNQSLYHGQEIRIKEWHEDKNYAEVEFANFQHGLASRHQKFDLAGRFIDCVEAIR